MRGKVLIVDDYSDWRDMLSGLIEREGHRVEAVGTGRLLWPILMKIKTWIW